MPPAIAVPPDLQIATTGPQEGVSVNPNGSAAGTTTQPAAPPVPMPVSQRPREAVARLITAEDLKGWKSGSLADYLKQQGLASSDKATGGNGD
jgi:hypothetical protein